MSLSAIGYRATARALKIVRPFLPGGVSPSANAGQLWLLRLGLFELSRDKEFADDWVWIIDHTIQTGNGKCFVVVGMRLRDWNARREEVLSNDPSASFALEHHDLSFWAIELMESSTGEAVREQLESLSASTGITPCCVLADQGADVRNGAELFSEGGATVLVHDIAHAVANAVKRQLNGTSAWQEFVTQANQFKTRIRQTPLAFLMPPDLKAKARWMNLQPLLDWAERVGHFLAAPEEALSKLDDEVDLETLTSKTAWFHDHRDSLAEWTTMLEASAIILKYIRNHGYHRDAARELKPRLSDFKDGPSRAVIDEVLSFVATQSSRVGDRRLPASSEVLESLIGKGKQLQGRNKNGYTKSILAMAASVVDLNCDTIQAAFDAVTTRNVTQWIATNLGLSLQAQRQRTLLSIPGTKTG